ncbi:mitochondrial translation protein [Penicillium angulare]|uniref:mitochondrial translation protein n=1 Tax=Penicillium angulare TaxID=116970 RepID=UPI00254071B6|nr:mitochondrial translation protein [Penicillium angulare]KAJ5279946.1 mitochondrial translation protein [Penicillium angulare]
MLRTSLRAVSDPLKDYICLSCLVRRNAAPGTSRQFHRASPLRFTSSGQGPWLNGQPALASSTQNSDADGVKTVNSSSTSQSEGGNAESKQPKQKQKPKHRSGSQSKLKARPPAKKPNKSSKDSNGDETKKTGDVKKKTGEDKKKTGEETKKSKKVINKISQLVEQSENQSQKNTFRKLPHLAPFVNNKLTGSLTMKEKVQPLDVPQPPVPGLSFGLDRVLFNPGVYQLRDPRSRVYNFDPYLGSIMPVTEFDFNTLKEYITSSKDMTLRDIAIKEGKKYAGSSSSMTSVLSQFHYLLSAWRGIDTRMVSQGFPDKLRTFTRLLRSPAAMFLHYQDGAYSIDADKEFDSANILMNLGKSMEKLLTMPKEDFERYRRTHENKVTPEEESAVPESYHFSTMGDFIMRSQLDAYDPRLPGTGMFDLKTRAVVSIRMDAQNFERGLGYEIKGLHGEYESYEREYFDMIRAAFLKYSLQVRIGRMDGIFVAFHNIERIFGFQYVSLPEMDQSLHGQSDTALGDAEFQLSLGLWNKVLDKVTERFPKKSLRLHFETRDAVTPFMYIFAEPVTKEQISSIQTKNKDKVEAYQQRILNLHPKTPETSESNLDKTSETETATTTKPESHTTSDPVFDSDAPLDDKLSNTEGPAEEETELIAMALTIQNKVNGKIVERPEKLTENDEWVVDYELSELSPTQGRALYNMCQTRRQKCLDTGGEDEVDSTTNMYIRRLQEISKKGRTHRAQENALDEEHGVVTYDTST